MYTVRSPERYIEFKSILIYSHSQISFPSWISGLMLCSPKDFTAPVFITRCFWNKYLLSGRGSEAAAPEIKGNLSCRDQHCSKMPFQHLLHSSARGSCHQLCFQAVSAPVSCCRIDALHCKWFEIMLNTFVACKNKSKQGEQGKKSREWNPVIR